MPKEWFRMKLKKAYIYILSFLSMSFLFSACYFLSYQHALRNFNKRAIERNGEYESLIKAAEPTPLLAAEEDDSIAAGTQASNTILPSTKYILEIYNMKTNTLDTENLNPPGYLVGLTKEEVETYLSDYMRDLTLSEYNKGLISYELTSFSDKEVHLRKTYNEDIVPYRFYVVVKDGYVVVYNSDLKSVYSYTHIEAKNLPEEDRIALSMGIYVNNLDELYALLESYSS
jgi:hypothetical protein